MDNNKILAAVLAIVTLIGIATSLYFANREWFEERRRWRRSARRRKQRRQQNLSSFGSESTIKDSDK